MVRREIDTVPAVARQLEEHEQRWRGRRLVGGPRDVLQPFESAAGHGRLVEAASVCEEPSGTFRL